MKKLVLVALAALSLCGQISASHAAHTSRCNDNWELHPGSCGQRVKNLQWLLGGHKPNVFKEVKPTFKYEPNGSYGARTKSAVTSYKYRIGYPRKGQCGATTDLVNTNVGPQFLAILEGKQKRPACWVALVSGRLKAIAASQPSKTALAVRSYELSQLGVTEHPLGSNWGEQVSLYQSSTGAYHAAWCVSFQQYSFNHIGYGHFAQDTAGVYYSVDYYAARNLTFAKAKVGSLVAFITYNSRGQRVPGTGHMGFVVAVQASSFTYVAGNDQNGVREHTIPMGSRPYVFIRLPNVA